MLHVLGRVPPHGVLCLPPPFLILHFKFLIDWPAPFQLSAFQLSALFSSSVPLCLCGVTGFPLFNFTFLIYNFALIDP